MKHLGKFLGSVFMIFLGAIAALICNGWIQHHYAQSDIKKIQNEVRTNRDELRKELDTFKTESTDRLQEELKLLRSAAADRNDEQAKKFEQLRTHRLSFAGFDTNAWDTAVAKDLEALRWRQREAAIG
jgi:hypothetical protein